MQGEGHKGCRRPSRLRRVYAASCVASATLACVVASALMSAKA